jgi:hypothetical protein
VSTASTTSTVSGRRRLALALAQALALALALCQGCSLRRLQAVSNRVRHCCAGRFDLRAGRAFPCPTCRTLAPAPHRSHPSLIPPSLTPFAPPPACPRPASGGDRPFLISGADDRLIKVWDYQTKACVHTLEGHSHNISSVCFHPELPVIITGGRRRRRGPPAGGGGGRGALHAAGQQLRASPAPGCGRQPASLVPGCKPPGSVAKPHLRPLAPARQARRTALSSCGTTRRTAWRTPSTTAWSACGRWATRRAPTASASATTRVSPPARPPACPPACPPGKPRLLTTHNPQPRTPIHHRRGDGEDRTRRASCQHGQQRQDHLGAPQRGADRQRQVAGRGV